MYILFDIKPPIYFHQSTIFLVKCLLIEKYGELLWNSTNLFQILKASQKAFHSIIKKVIPQNFVIKYLLVWYHEQDNGSSGGFTNILRFENTALS